MMIKGELEKKMKKMIIISSVIVVLLLTMSIFFAYLFKSYCQK